MKVRKTFSGLCAAVVLIVAGLAANADPSEEQSRDHARRALTYLLEDGDRSGGIREALLGLPNKPVADDLERYPEAWSALWRAFASRSIRVAVEGQVSAALSPDGTRAIISPEVSNPMTPDARQSVTIFEPLTGRIVGEPIVSGFPMHAGYIGSAHTVISTDGQLAAIQFTSDDPTHIIDLSDGSRVSSYPAFGSAVEFSPDGRGLMFLGSQGLSNGPGTVEVRDLRSGSILFQTEVPPYTSMVWASATTIFATTNVGGDTTEPRVNVTAIELDGSRYPILEDLPIENGGIIMSPTEPVFLVISSREARLFDMSGQQRAVLSLGVGLAGFVREGTAVAIPRLNEAMGVADMQVAVYALDGTPLETQASDYVGFDQFVYGPSGQILGGMGFLSPSPLYEGAGLPTGLDLHRAAIALVGSPGQVAAPEVDPVLQKSEEFARSAGRLLKTGDRMGAIAEALKGLPGDPTAEDFERFSAAHLMLYRSTASRSLRLPLRRATPAAIGPKGDVLAVSGDAPGLYATPEGALIAPLRGVDGDIFASTTLPHFSAAGDLLVLAESRKPILHVYDGRTGEHRLTVEFPISDISNYSAYSTIIGPAGFSHDDGELAVTTNDHLFLISTSDWNVRQFDFPGRTGAFVSWLPDRRLLLTEPIYTHGEGPVAQMYIHDGTSILPMMTIMSDAEGLRSAPLYMAASQLGNAAMAEEGDSTDGRVVILDGAGQVRVVATEHDGHVQFVRDGTAIAYRNPKGDRGTSLIVQSLVGEQLTPRFEDHVALDQRVFDERGNDMMLGSMSSLYRGADVPKGRVLFDMALELLSGAILTEVERQRIVSH